MQPLPPRGPRHKAQGPSVCVSDRQAHDLQDRLLARVMPRRKDCPGIEARREASRIRPWPRAQESSSPAGKKGALGRPVSSSGRQKPESRTLFPGRLHAASRRDPLLPAEAGANPYRMAGSYLQRDFSISSGHSSSPQRKLYLRTTLRPAQYEQTPSPCGCKPTACGTLPDPGSALSQGAGRGWPHAPAQAEGYAVTAPTSHSRKWPRKCQRVKLSFGTSKKGSLQGCRLFLRYSN